MKPSSWPYSANTGTPDMARRGYSITLQAIDELPVVQRAYDEYRARVHSFLVKEVDRLAAEVIRRAVARAGTIEIPLSIGRAQFAICQTGWHHQLPHSVSVVGQYTEERNKDSVDTIIKEGTQVGEDFRLEEDANLTMQVFTAVVARLPQALKDAWVIAVTKVSIKKQRTRRNRAYNPDRERQEEWEVTTNRHAVVTIRLPTAPPEPPVEKTEPKPKTARMGKPPKSRTFRG